MHIADYLDSRLVAFLESNSQEEAIKTLVNMVAQTGLLQDKYSFYDAIMQREKIVSTGIGMGTAIPHAKLPHLTDFFIAIGILKKGVEWKALDSSPVRIIFLIGGPDSKQTEYLSMLSKLTQVIKDDQIRKKMLALNSPEDIINLFT